jgi:hypothetical protein
MRNHIIKEIKSLKSTVTTILEKEPTARDNDRYLHMAICMLQDRVLRENPPFEYFVDNYMNGKYVNFASIERCRRKIQEEREDLRGNTYKSRSEEAEGVKNGING